MEVEALFNDLESNNPQEYEEAKKQIAEFFNLTKDPWLVKDMMDYYMRTNSFRVIDVLTKVQHPHDIFVFDRLAEWLKSNQHRTASLSLFGFIVRKHPTWLHKVSKHKLIRDIFKLLQNEREIVPLMSALLCIITLLPIIPSSTQQFLPDLFEVFGHLASWNCQNPNRLSEYQLIHLQLGLHMLFQRLYGMYPWHFIMYLREFILKEKNAIFQHTIKPLLETVKIHPLLITATKETEASTSRWKDMEPHDVVVDCAKLSLALYNQDHNPDCCVLLRCQDAPHSFHLQQQSTSIRETPFESITEFASPFHSLMQREKHMDYSKFDQIWSPHIEILATPPPTGAIPHTPTPNYVVPLVTSSSNTNSILGVSGSSPPEAAVEATPETTPMKDLNLKRVGLIATKPHAVRSILGSSQPSSPMRKEQSPFNFPDNNCQQNFGQIALTQNIVETTTTTNVTSLISNTSTVTSQRFLQMVNDRNQSLRDIQQLTGLKNSGQMLSSLDSPTFPSESTREDQEVTELTNYQLGMVSSGIGGPQNSDTLQDISSACDEDCNESERSPCSAGGLHVPTNRTMQLFVNRIKRNRLATYCQNDTSSYLSYGTSPADVSTNEMFHRSVIAKAKVRRTNSWPVIDRKLSIDENTIDFEELTTTAIRTDQLGNMIQQNGDSSSPSGDDVMSAATHFKKLQQKRDRKQANIINFTNQQLLSNNNGENSIVSHNRSRNDIPKVTSSTQTIQQWPQIYEYNLLELFFDDNKKRNAAELEPHEILNQYIDRTIKVKYSNDTKNCEDEFKEQLQLLYLQLQYERHRREIHAERNRRLLGRSREKRTLELENIRLRDQLRNIDEENKSLISGLKTITKSFQDKETKHNKELNIWKSKYQSEVDDNKQMKFKNETIQRQLNDEIKCRQEINQEIDILRGQIFDMRNELQYAQYQAELGLHYKQDLIKLETEFMVMGEVQIKCRDRLNEIDNLRARDEELKILQATFKNEINELRSSLDDKTTHLERAKYRLNELQSQLVNKEVVFTDQKRLLKSVKDEYEEKFRALNKKYEAQKAIILQMEQKIIELYKNRTAVNLSSPESERADIASSPLSTSASSGDNLSASLRSVTELCNLQSMIVNDGAGSGGGSSLISTRNQYSTISTSQYQQQSRLTTDYSSSRYPTIIDNSSINATGLNQSITASNSITSIGRETAGSLDIPVSGSSQQNHHYSSAHHK